MASIVGLQRGPMGCPQTSCGPSAGWLDGVLRRTYARWMVKAIPEGYHTVTPHLVVRGADKAIQFYQAAFGAEELVRMPTPDGKLMHAEIRIGDSVVMLADEFPEMGSKSPDTLGGTSNGLMIYSENVNQLWDRAVKAGAAVEMPLTDMFWGDRYGKLRDPFGQSWALAQHVRDVSPEEMAESAKQSFGG
jgi:PhnB protein